ncbi:hypothetical protein [Amycolatopsis sp. WGS_07]|uniref:hypothetical protein n=1 Tax=Amycolatopsis sp. WGS_07 TaxID=3076764 RepID=UPI003873A963
MTAQRPRAATPPGSPRRPAARYAAGLLAVAATVLTGCAEADQPAPNSTGQTAGPGAPAVATPLDLTRLKRAPCEALNPAQDALDPAHAGLHGPGVPAVPSSRGAAPACEWKSRAATLIVYIPAHTDNTLTAIHRMKGAQYPVVTPLAPIGGYPAVAYGADTPSAATANAESRSPPAAPRPSSPGSPRHRRPHRTPATPRVPCWNTSSAT